MDIVNVDGVSYSYPDGTTGVGKVDFSIGKGESIGIIGPNGSGKSTFLTLIAGLIEPDSGSVKIFGEDPGVVRDRIGFLMQDADDFLFNSTVREDLLYGPSQFDLDEDRVEELVDYYSDILSLDGLLDKPPFRLSEGEKKRAALGSVLSFDPDLLLLDEPLDSIDLRHRARVMDLLNDLKDEGVTLVLSTQNLEVLPELVEKACLFNSDKKIVKSDELREILTDVELLEKSGLRPPSLIKIFSELKTEKIPISNREAIKFIKKSNKNI